MHKELQEAINEEDRIITEMDKIFKSTPDRAEAEKIILEKWVLPMDEAVKKSGELVIQWREAINKSQQEYESGLGDKN